MSRKYTLVMWYEIICVMMHLFVLTSSFEEYMQEEIWSEKSSRNLLKGLRFSFLEVIVLVFIAALFGICINRSLFGESKYMRHTNVLGFFIKAHLDTRDTVIFLTTLCQKTSNFDVLGRKLVYMFTACLREHKRVTTF